MREHADSKPSAADRLREQSAVVSLLSHELRSPIGAIRMWATLLQEGKLDAAKTARALDAIERSAARQAKLLDELIDAARIVAGTVRLAMHPVDLAGPVAAAVTAARPSAADRAVELVTAAAPQVIVRGDPARLQQVVAHLLSNAIKFSPPGGRVDIGLAVSEGFATLSVHDAGIGLGAAELDSVFERLGASHHVSADAPAGRNLGLTLVRHLVQLHGGSVHAQSPGKDRGATFTVRLPAMEGGGA